ncbi:MAG: DUF2157 domain-containing protein [Cyclobacteriaceae bacterium]|nr:DUF2157 domain-containing protein [Cyclobacteriaceae bacterium]
MIGKFHKELFERNLLTQEQHDHVEEIATRRVVSVYYDLRMLLYAGVLLFSAGIGILIYKNIGEIGHLVAIGVLMALTATCFVYMFRKGPRYHHREVEGPTPYFEYVVLLGSLLLITVQGYLQFKYELLTENLGISTLISAAVFFVVAYRFDHLGVLSLGITALASFFSITLSPNKWYSGDFLEGSHLYLTAIFFGSGLALAALLLEKKDIKVHFTFTYLNFALLIFFAGALSGMMIEEGRMGWYLLLVYAGVGFAWVSARKRRSFLFLLYAFIAGYIGTTYLLSETVMQNAEALWFYYFMLSCGGFVYFMVKYRNYFSRNA